MANVPIDRDYFEEKFAHVFTKLESLLQRQNFTDENIGKCQGRCVVEMKDVYDRLRHIETSSELNAEWIKRHDKHEAQKPHWVHAFGAWAKVVLIILGALLGAIATFVTMVPH